MTTIAVLPIKRLREAKRRLEPALDPGSRRALVEAMLSDALAALRRCAALDRTIVVTSDPDARRIATAHAADVLDDDGAPGHSAAARRGVDHAIALGADRALLVPGDCPLLDPAEVDALVRRPAASPSLLVVPDRHDTGTNALLITPPDALAPSFGEGSHARHLAHARDAGVAAETVRVGSLALDVDTIDDLAAIDDRLSELAGAAPHTRGVLRELNHSRR